VPIAIGCMLANLPLSGITSGPVIDALGKETQAGGFLYYMSFGTVKEIYPVIIFMGIGAMTDFAPLLANPITFLLGAAAQLGVFVALFGAMMLGFSVQEAASIAIIGGADGPTSIYLCSKLAPQILGAVAVASYSYMSLVPLIQPPIIKLCTSKKDRAIRMDKLRPVTKLEKILFPIVVTGLILPMSVPLIGVLMFGNLLRECGCTDRLSDTAQNAIMNTTTIFLSLTVGATMEADKFLTIGTIKIIVLGLVAFMASTAGGCFFGQLLKVLSGGKINPMIGAAGVSAVPMAARVVQVVSQKENPGNFLLMHAMGPNVAGVIGTAVAAATMLTLLSH
ncbi:MAG: sodium ion-translocating decarboxylase subunit beta, partial [Pyramidobacter sp.]|nr:sodium ion-translocating decarboxylase subunit beta [Pyramidobacter sp.]